MTVVFHPDFPKDIRKFEHEYAALATALAQHFRREIDEGLEAIKASPGAAGHFLNIPGFKTVPVRRRNLRSFPFFILYGAFDNRLIFGAVIPSRSDPLTWLTRFRQT